MRIRIKKQGLLHSRRIDAPGMIENVVVHEDFLHPEQRIVALYFRGENASGIMHFTYPELAQLLKSLKPGLSLVKKSKILKE